MIEVGNEVMILIGPHKSKIAKVVAVDMNGGARNGWITVECGGKSLLFAGEELLVMK